jgi:hypothetical protein
MSLEDVTSIQPYSSGGGGEDPYALPQDPYMNQVSRNNMNAQLAMAILETKFDKGTDINDYESIFWIVLDNLGRIPNADLNSIHRFQRDFIDIRELAECQGTEEMTGSLMRQLLFDMRSYVSYGGSELKGLTGISAIITQRQQSEQTVKMPAPEPAQKKKLFGRW